MKSGKAVLDYLNQTTDGQKLVQAKGINLKKLAGTLTIKQISVSDQILKDNQGSVVDASGIPGLITLSKDRWLEHFEHQRDIYYLVFHEMLRDAAYNDDNYVISGPLNPFPQTRRIATRIATVVPLIGSDLLADQIDPAAISIGGSGCPKAALGEQADFDIERKLLDISFANYSVKARDAFGKSLDRKACALVIPVHGKPGKRLVISQIDFLGAANLAPNASATLKRRFLYRRFLWPTSSKVSFNC